jgi:hypothetical protein
LSRTIIDEISSLSLVLYERSAYTPFIDQARSTFFRIYAIIIIIVVEHRASGTVSRRFERFEIERAMSIRLVDGSEEDARMRSIKLSAQR